MKIYRDWDLESTNHYDLDLSKSAAMAYNYFDARGLLGALDATLSELYPDGISEGEFEVLLRTEDDYLAELLGVESLQDALDSGAYSNCVYCDPDEDDDEDPCDDCDAPAGSCSRCPSAGETI